MASYDYGFAFAMDDVCTRFPVPPIKAMEVGVDNHRARTHVDIITDADRLMTVDASVGYACVVANGQFRMGQHLDDRHRVVVYRTANPSTPAYKIISDDDFTAWMELQICFAIKMNLVRIELDIMGMTTSNVDLLVYIFSTSSQHTIPDSGCVIDDG